MIVARLDQIVSARREALTARYAVDYPGLPESDVSRIAEGYAEVGIRIIAEEALSLLSDEQVDRLLGRFSASRGPARQVPPKQDPQAKEVARP